MSRLHREIQQASDAIKEARAAVANARERHEGDPRAGTIKASTPGQPSYVRLLYGGKQKAAYTRKHGHGNAWKHRYKVLRVRPHSVLLEVPKDGSVPDVTPWQLIRLCEPAPADEVHPHPDDPRMTESGFPCPPAVTGGTAAADQPAAWDPDEVFDIDKIVSAEKVSGRWQIWVKWTGWEFPTPEWQTQLLPQGLSDELLQEIENAKQRWRDQNQRHSGDSDDEDADEHSHTDPATAGPGDPGPQTYGRGAPRDRRQPERYGTVHLMDTSSYEVEWDRVFSICYTDKLLLADAGAFLSVPPCLG